MTNKDILLIVFPFLSAIISSWLTYYFAIRSKRDEAILKFKEEKYANLLLLMQGFVGNTISGDLKREFFKELYKSWLYASDEVIKSINAAIQFLISLRGKAPDSDQGIKLVGNIVLEMRKDLYGKTSLDWKDFRYIDVNE